MRYSAKGGRVVRRKKWKKAACARCQGRPGGTSDDPLTRGSEGSLRLLAFSGLEQSAIENCSHLIGPVN